MKRLLLPLLAAIALPTTVNAEITNDYILKVEQSTKLFSEGKFSEMTKICEELIEISPELDFGYVCKGIALGFNRENQKKREALRNFTKAIKINPENYDAYFFRGALKFTMRRRRDLGFNRSACDDMEKAYLNKNPFALQYVKKYKSNLAIGCVGF
tara:strand:- start:3 stop:470 length:468 start_codon:yes stop_codon:yes gene_type:complete